jgi:putative spermidine/putrescine transport system ATP-binding protein
MADSIGVPVRLRGCAKTFRDGTRALEPLNLSIEGGETLVLLGPSGCGKTTTLRIIAGLESPDAGGRVCFGEEDVTDVPIERRNVGMVFQSYALFPNLDVAGNIAYGLKVRRVDEGERQRRVDSMLAMMHLGPLRDRRIDQLSGGQKQRVALARALAVQPRVLLMDEPLTALDAKLREELRLEINALLRGLRITTVYVTHDQSEAMALGDRIVVMSHGRVAQVGPPREIYHRPANAFVANFIGTTNRLQGRVEEGWLVFPGGRLRLPESVAGESEVYFRPEDAAIVDGTPETPAEGVLAGVVSAVSFLGDRTRLLVEGAGPEPIIVEADPRRELRAGDRIHLRIEAGRLLGLARSEPA